MWEEEEGDEEEEEEAEDEYVGGSGGGGGGGWDRKKATTTTTTGVNHKGLSAHVALAASWTPLATILGPSWDIFRSFRSPLGGLFGLLGPCLIGPQ